MRVAGACCGKTCGHFLPLATGSYYGDAFVKPFLAVRTACQHRPEAGCWRAALTLGQEPRLPPIVALDQWQQWLQQPDQLFGRAIVSSSSSRFIAAAALSVP